MQLEAYLGLNGRSLRDEEVTLTLQEVDANPGLGAIVVMQRHGELVKVPAGWLHSVQNLAPCVKFAWECAVLEHAAHYPTVHRLIAQYIGERAAKDYFPTQAIACNTVIQSS